MLDGDAEATELLRHGRIEVQGRLVEASNATLFCSIEHAGISAECVYKPVRGERPLWDFPDGTLAGREVATYKLAEAIGWNLVPPTVLRDGPFGPGMVQLWIDTEDGSELVDLTPPDEVVEGWLPVLRAQDHHGEEVVLAHADHTDLRRLAVLDVLINNADRKGGHILHSPRGRVFGIDHGVSLNAEGKLRTVLWGWIGQELTSEVVDRLGSLRVQLNGELATELVEHITPKEVQAVDDRIERLLRAGELPAPSGDWPAIPWPAF
ncbi:SCO1664 family protein [Parasphingorhabdus pacifica]